MSGLPAWIGATLDAKLDHKSRTALRERAEAISETYRAGGGSDVIRSDIDALAYALVRMPATYAAMRAALAQATQALPDVAPESILDIGAGPGTASWAAIDCWSSVRRVHWIERNGPLLVLARAFAAADGAPRIDLSVTVGDVAASLADVRRADVVMASYALTEIAHSADMLASLWDLTGRLLVLVEPGTMAGFQHIRTHRDFLLAKGATLVAPCSHHGACPLAGHERWCHFGVRLPRSRDHLLIKSASVPYEDEKFSYLIAGKGFDAITRGHRVLATPRVSKAGVTLDVCAPDTVERRTITRRQKEEYRNVKRCDWGDALP